METYVLTAPVFYFGKTIKTIGDEEETFGIDIPIPRAFVKSVFAELSNGKFKLWTFLIDNKPHNKPLSNFLVKTYDAEQYVGGRFWDRVSGGDLHKQKKSKGRMWSSKSDDTGEWTIASLMKLKEAAVVKIANDLGIDATEADLKSETVDKIVELSKA